MELFLYKTILSYFDVDLSLIILNYPLPHKPFFFLHCCNANN